MNQAELVFCGNIRETVLLNVRSLNVDLVLNLEGFEGYTLDKLYADGRVVYEKGSERLLALNCNIFTEGDLVYIIQLPICRFGSRVPTFEWEGV